MSSDLIVAFRTTGGKQTGFGHIRRCLSLAEALRDAEVTSIFLLDGDAASVAQVERAGFPATRIRPEMEPRETAEHLLNCDAAAVVVDSYGVQSDYFRALSETRLLTVAVDDLADRDLPVDLVVNGSVGAEGLRYSMSPHTNCLLGTRYLLLRKEFATEPAREAAPTVGRVLVTVGGSDPHGLTERLTRCVRQSLATTEIDVVIGPLFGVTSDLPSGVCLHRSPDSMRDLMLRADLALCAGGQTTYELAATGTPSVAVRVADNQTANLEGLAAAGALLWVGDTQDPHVEACIKLTITALAGDHDRRAKMSQRSRSLVDGRGAERVARFIATLLREERR